MDYTLKLEQFEGPLHKLLELVLAEELDISMVSLAKVTSGFLAYVEKLEEKHISNEILAEFLGIASKLLLIKSKVLIPTLELDEEEEEDIRSLELQLAIYRAMKEASLRIKSGWGEFPKMASREFLLSQKAIFYPPKINSGDLYKSLTAVIKEIEKLRPVKSLRVEFSNLEEIMKDVLGKIAKKPMRVNRLTHKKRDELVTLFLAILHLLKNGAVEVTQERQFGEIVVAKKRRDK